VLEVTGRREGAYALPPGKREINMSTRETNIRRLLQEAQEGMSLSDLTEIDRNDLWSVAQIDLSPYESNNLSADSQVYGELTLREVKLAQRLSRILPLATQ
jgi:hypothetical protein